MTLFNLQALTGDTGMNTDPIVLILNSTGFDNS
jgi:hypothetical protein